MAVPSRRRRGGGRTPSLMKLCAACRAPLTSDAWQCDQCRWQAVRREGVTVLLPEGAEVAEGFSREQFENLLAVMPRHFWFAARNRLLAWAVQRHTGGNSRVTTVSVRLRPRW